MLRFEDIVFGPIQSRRLGASLGVNLLPAHGKICNFDCVYCECGWNKDGRDDKKLPGYEEVSNALESRLKQLSPMILLGAHLPQVQTILLDLTK